MTSVDIIYDKIHFRHESKWSGRLGPAEGGGVLLCVACVIEMLESENIAVSNVSSLIWKERFPPAKMNHLLGWMCVLSFRYVYLE